MWNFCRVCGDVPQEPVLAGRVSAYDFPAWIMLHDDREALRPFGNGRPRERRGQAITPVAAAFEIAWQVTAPYNSRTCQRERVLGGSGTRSDAA
jgi:hypothetical protein